MGQPEPVLPFFRLRMPFEPVLALSGRARIWFSRAFLPWAIMLLAAISYYAGSQIGFLLTPKYTPISTFWPPNAIVLAILLLTPSRIWWVIMLAVLPAHLLIQLKTGIPLATSLTWFAGNTGEALLGAALTRHFARHRPLFRSLRGVVVFLTFGILLPTFVTSFLDAGGVRLTGLGRDFWGLWATRLTSNVVSDLTIVPIIVIVGLSGISWLREIRLARYFEAAALVFALVATSLLVFGREGSASSIPLICLPLLPLVWAAVRFGCGGLSVSMLGVALISLWNTVHGRGPLGAQGALDGVLAVRVLLIVFCVPLMLSAALLAERLGNEVRLKTTRNDLIRAHEQESHRIARELHTDIAGRLTLVSLGVDQFRTKSDVAPSLDRLYGEIQRVWTETLELSHAVYPFTVEYLGLENALKKLCYDTGAHSGVNVSFSAESVPSSLSVEASRRLFRLAKKALDNIIQYSHATRATVELRGSGGRVFLRIAAPGVDINAHRAEGIGLRWMCEQVLSLEGTFEITGAPQAGTLIEASVPIQVSS
jgi:signal transduction histidine kinase